MEEREYLLLLNLPLLEPALIERDTDIYTEGVLAYHALGIVLCPLC